MRACVYVAQLHCGRTNSVDASQARTNLRIQVDLITSHFRFQHLAFPSYAGRQSVPGPTRKMIRAFLLLAVFSHSCYCLDNGLGRTPQMGWNSWNHFACHIDANLIKKTADLMISTGLAEVGYNYLNLDDCWAEGRDSHGNVFPSAIAFPGGMTPVGKYIHSKGLKFGIYSDAGTMTCAKRPGSLGYEYQDALQYAKWEVDYLKYDNCNNGSFSGRERYPIMRDALNRTGRPIFFSICEWGVDSPATWAGDVGNSWRTTGDIDKSWARTMYCLDTNAPLFPHAGPGKWNDPDMLEVGNGMSDIEGQSHFSLWALMKAPLLIGCDLSQMSAATKATLMNKEVIAVNQDPLGIQGQRTSPANPKGGELWQGELSDGSIAAILFNRNDNTTVNLTVSFIAAFDNVGDAPAMSIRDLWLHKDLGHFKEFSALVPPHGVCMLKVAPVTGAGLFGKKLMSSIVLQSST